MPPSTLGHNIKVLSICLDFLEFLRRLLPLPVFLSCASSIKRFKSDSWPNTRVASQLNPPRGKKGRKKALVLNTDNKKSISADTRPHPHPDTETGQSKRRELSTSCFTFGKCKIFFKRVYMEPKLVPPSKFCLLSLSTPTPPITTPHTLGTKA